jgi:uncharacterized membrane protein
MLSTRQARPVSKGIAALLIALVVALVLPARLALADDYSIDQVNIDATVNTDGSVDVLEHRTFDFDGDFHGVYWKIPSGYYEGRMVEPTITTVGEMVSGTFVPFDEDYSGYDHTYQVDDYGSYVRVKLYSAHSDEDATFVIGYTDSNLAARYDDVSELYWKFVSDGWDVTSHNVTCVVHLPVPAGKQVEPEENVRAWGHGPLDASVSFDGNDVVYVVPGVGTSEFAEARITFPDDWLSDATSQGGTVLQEILAEERAWADEANARRTRARRLTYGGAGIEAIATIGSIIAAIYAMVRYRRTHKAAFDDKYFRDVPSDDHPAVLGALYRDGSVSGEDFTATLMRLTDMGAITLELVTIESKGMLGRVKTREDYRLTLTSRAETMDMSDIDRKALDTIFEKVGRFAPSNKGDGKAGTSVCFGDLEKVAKKHPERYHDAFSNWNAKVDATVATRQFFRECKGKPSGRALAITCFVLDVVLFVASVLLLIATEAWLLFTPLILLQILGCILSIYIAIKCVPISDEAIELKAKLEALRRWLKDFTRLEEAVPRDVVLWNRLLVMAVVLGVADEVIKQLKMIAPEMLESSAMAPTYGWYYVGPHGRPYESFNSSYESAHHVSSAALAASESSSGGGGGGGFSGGGGGGFGGGGGGGAF